MVSIIIPWLRREGMQRCVAAIRKNAGLHHNLYEIITEEDTERIGVHKMIARLTGRAKFDMVMFLADDLTPEPGFLAAAIQAMAGLPDGWGLVALNFGQNDGRAGHWLAHKRLLPLLGGEFHHTGYRHQYGSDELTDCCREMGRYVFVEDARIIHEQIDDEETKRNYSPEANEHDRMLYHRRRLARKPAMKLGIGIPVLSQLVYSDFFISFLTMEKPDFVLLLPAIRSHPDIPQAVTCTDMGAVRNSLVDQALEYGCTHIVMMDTDQKYKSDTLMKLLSHIDAMPVVAGVVHRRYPPFDPIMYRGEINKYKHLPLEQCYSGELVEVDAVGTGCILFDLRIFLDMKQPWFKDCTREDINGPGEDIYFCSRLRQAGIKIMVNTAVQVGHLGLMEVNRTSHWIWRKINSQGE